MKTDVTVAHTPLGATNAFAAISSNISTVRGGGTVAFSDEERESMLNTGT